MSKTIEIAQPGVRATVDALLEKYRGQQIDAPVASRQLAAVGVRMVAALRDVTRQYGKTVGADQVAGINDLLRDWDTAIADARAVPTWRSRIGRGDDFPLHAPNDVERAMEAEIAELRATVAAWTMSDHNSQDPSCSCPSGNGSLVWPCPVHPAPTARAAWAEEDQWIFDLAAEHEMPTHDIWGPLRFSATGIVAFVDALKAREGAKS